VGEPWWKDTCQALEGKRLAFWEAGEERNSSAAITLELPSKCADYQLHPARKRNQPPIHGQISAINQSIVPFALLSATDDGRLESAVALGEFIKCLQSHSPQL